jgi:hypothetical protein
MIGYARLLLVWRVQEVCGQFGDDWELPRRRRRAGSLDLMVSSSCACEKTRPAFRPNGSTLQQHYRWFEPLV